MHTWVKSKQQNTIRDGGNTALYTALFTLLTTLGQLLDEFETALKQFCDFFEENLKTTLGPL